MAATRSDALVVFGITGDLAKDAKVAGVIAFYPYCFDNVDPTVPTLVVIGEKDDWTPAAVCQSVKYKANFEGVVYPGATHAFTRPWPKPFDFQGHDIVYDEQAAKDGMERAEALIASHLK